MKSSHFSDPWVERLPWNPKDATKSSNFQRFDQVLLGPGKRQATWVDETRWKNAGRNLMLEVSLWVLAYEIPSVLVMWCEYCSQRLTKVEEQINFLGGGGGQNGPSKTDVYNNSENIVKHSGLARGTPKPHAHQAQLAFWHRVQPEQLMCVSNCARHQILLWCK